MCSPFIYSQSHIDKAVEKAIMVKDAEIAQWKRVLITHVDVIAEKDTEITRLTAANSALQKEVEGLKEEYDTADKAVRLANQEVAKLQNEKRKLTTALAAQEKVIEEIHDWQCGCGHWNGCNLPFCATCGRRPNET